ncbi:SAM-dependent methyltransferase [Mycolicibacterium thermoresistibile]
MGATRAARTDTWLPESAWASALRAAEVRTVESGCACPLFTDPYAQLLFDAAIARGWDRPTPPVADRDTAVVAYLASRTKWFDEFLMTAGANGLEQVVLLAPGLDARAWRLPWIDGTAVYEVDHPQVLQLKNATLHDQGTAPATRCVAVPVDRQAGWCDALRRAGFDETQPTAWVVERLPADPIAAFEDICALSASGSRLAVEVPENHTGIDLFIEHGWEISKLTAATLLDRYGRCCPDDESDATAHTVFVEGHCQAFAGEIAS